MKRKLSGSHERRAMNFQKEVISPGTWKAYGSRLVSEFAGTILFTDVCHENRAFAEPNSSIRFDRIRQGQRRMNPLLQNTNAFPLLYLLPRVTDPRGTILYMDSEILRTSRTHPSFVRACMGRLIEEGAIQFLSKVLEWEIPPNNDQSDDLKKWSFEGAWIKDCEVNMGEDVGFNPTVEEHQREIASDMLGKILLNAAHHGGEALEQVSNAAKAIDNKLNLLGTWFRREKTNETDFAEDYRLLDLITRLSQQRMSVPLNCEVQEAFLSRFKGAEGLDERQYRRRRDALGFKWLPTS